jgi:LysR family transcriptional regulator, hydrogen peroxide-inducible genes activator
MSVKRPTIKQLEYFVAIAKSSNFRKAAQKLQVSQPTLTLQIAALEEDMGVQLFDRSRAGTLLTPAGRDLLPLARDILEQYQQLTDIVAGRGKDLAGSFRMGVSPTIGPILLPKVLPQLHKRYPDLKLHVREDVPKALEAGLNTGTYDLILTVLPMHAGDNKIRPLFTEPVRVVVPSGHPLTRKQKLHGRDLLQQGVLSIDENHHLHRQILTLCDRYGARLLRQYECNTLSALRLMLLLGMGIAVLPALFIQSELAKSEHVKVYTLEDEPLTRTHIAMWRKNSSARALFQLLSFEIKAIAMEQFGGLLEEVYTDDNLPDTW